MLTYAGVDCQIHTSLAGFDNPAKPVQELLTQHLNLQILPISKIML